MGSGPDSHPDCSLCASLLHQQSGGISFITPGPRALGSGSGQWALTTGAGGEVVGSVGGLDVLGGSHKALVARARGDAGWPVQVASAAAVAGCHPREACGAPTTSGQGRKGSGWKQEVRVGGRGQGGRVSQQAPLGCRQQYAKAGEGRWHAPAGGPERHSLAVGKLTAATTYFCTVHRVTQIDPE